MIITERKHIEKLDVDYICNLSAYVKSISNISLPALEVLKNIQDLDAFLDYVPRLSHFVPVDPRNGQFMEKPIVDLSGTAAERQERGAYKKFGQDSYNYEFAQENVLFEGFEVVDGKEILGVAIPIGYTFVKKGNILLSFSGNLCWVYSPYEYDKTETFIETERTFIRNYHQLLTHTQYLKIRKSRF